MHQLNRSDLSRALALTSLLALGACSSSSPPSTTAGSGGSTTGAGGNATGTGGQTTGTGGSTTGAGGSATGAGGNTSATGGSPGTGGSAGGSPGTGGAAGGSPGSGGAGGQIGTGGAGGHGPGGTSGAGNSGGAAGTGGSAPGTCKYKLCEDFESSTVGSIPTGWTSFQGYNGTIGAMDEAVATDAAHSGTKSLKSIAASQGTARIQKALSSLGATASKHWGRIFYKVQSPSAVDSSNYLHTTFVSLMGGTTEDRVVDTVEMPGTNTHQWLLNTPDDMCCANSKCCPTSSYDWTFDGAWHCAEWYVDLTTKSYRFFSDSQEVTQIAFSGHADAEMPATFDEIILGATYYQHDTLTAPFTMWIDDLAIDDTRIGCQ